MGECGINKKWITEEYIYRTDFANAAVHKKDEGQAIPPFRRIN